jgi:putative ABC transport system substrate-binding protein
MRELVADFLAGLNEQGFVEQQSVLIEYRWADEHKELLPQLAADLVSRRVSAIAAAGGTQTALAAKAATATIPVVFTIGADPVRAGLVQSLSRPGGNITGISGFTDQLITKRLEIVNELLPNVTVIGALLNPSNPNSDRRAGDLRLAADAVGRKILILPARDAEELARAFESGVQPGVGALVVQNDIVFFTERDRIVSLASRYRMPTIYETRENVVAGGLLSYGTSISERFRLLGEYTGKILRGHKPVDLPVMQPTKFHLIINLQTARSLGLEVPPMLLARADEVIE